MKAKITKTTTGCVALAYDSHGYDADRRVVRLFCCPIDGGYVTEQIKGEWRQVCERLSSTGITLSCSSRDALGAMIRKHYQSMKRAQSRAEEK